MRQFPITFNESIPSGITSAKNINVAPNLNPDDFLTRNTKAAFTIRMNGRAMEKAGIAENAYLLFDSGIDAKNGDIVYVSYNQEKLVRFYEKHGNNITLYAATPGYPAIQVDSELDILGVVTWSFNKHRNKEQG